MTAPALSINPSIHAPFPLDIKSLALVFHFTLEVICSSGKLLENKETEESPGLALSSGIASFHRGPSRELDNLGLHSMPSTICHVREEKQVLHDLAEL